MSRGKPRAIVADAPKLYGVTIAAWAMAMGQPAISWDAPIHPIALARARVVFGKSRTYAHLPDRSVHFREELQLRWKAAKLKRQPGPLAVALAFQGRGFRGDVDNMAKAILDAGNEILWHDDREILALMASITAWGPGQEPLVALDIWRIP
jgi:Holliday junction resolvase RusA-like endonuclease